MGNVPELLNKIWKRGKGLSLGWERLGIRTKWVTATLSFAFHVTDKNSQSLAVLNDEETNEILSNQVKDILWDNNLRFKVMT